MGCLRIWKIYRNGDKDKIIEKIAEIEEFVQKLRK